MPSPHLDPASPPTTTDSPVPWQESVMYELFLRSFADGNGDGIGDLPGATSRLDYLQWLGIDYVWLTAFYTSPLVDCAYDVIDHCAVHPEYGTLEDFDAFVAEAHRRGLRVLTDYVPAHTSNQHSWFIESASSRNNPRRDWYLWQDPGPGGGPPNNWSAEYGGSAWEWHEPTGQYYLHRFQVEQPYLNWRNPDVRAAMYDVLRFWLRRGVDGFRIDAIHVLTVDRLLRNNPENPAWRPGGLPAEQLARFFSEDMPDTMPLIREMRRVVDEFPDKLLCGELFLDAPRLVNYYQGDAGLHFPLNYRLTSTPWRAPAVRFAVDELESSLPDGCWPSWAVGNHDQARVARRVGPDGARLAALLLLTIRGVPLLYYGDEIGLLNDDVPPDRMQDITGRTIRRQGVWRDTSRTPMQWNDRPNAGFSSAEPWLPVSPDYEVRNVDHERQESRSILNLYRHLLELRRSSAALRLGAYRPLYDNNQLFAFMRELGDERWVVALNFSPDPAEFEPGHLLDGATIVLSTRFDRGDEPLQKLTWLRGQEGILVRLR